MPHTPVGDKDVLDMAGRAPFYFGLLSLLTIIVSKSEGYLDPKYEKTLDATALIEGHPELIGRLEEAWKARSFKDIRNLSASFTLSGTT